MSEGDMSASHNLLWFLNFVVPFEQIDDGILFIGTKCPKIWRKGDWNFIFILVSMPTDCFVFHQARKMRRQMGKAANSCEFCDCWKFPTFSPISPHPTSSVSLPVFAMSKWDGRTDGRTDGRKDRAACWTGGSPACWRVLCGVVLPFMFSTVFT